MSLNMNDLSSGLLKYILDFLDDTQLFLVEKNMQKWQKCVLQLEKKKELKHFNDLSTKFKKP